MRSPLFLAVHLRTLFLGFAIPFLAAAWWWATPHLVAPVTAATEGLAGKVVVLDPGHGGVDPGAVGQSGLLEKDVVLGVARALRPLLARAAVQTIMVRDGDSGLADYGVAGGSRQREELKARVALANQAGADLYISLHANSFPSSRWSGAQTFYYPGKEEGRRLAEAIQARLREAFPENRRWARPGEYFVLRETTMPATVVEVGFLSNPHEEGLLRTSEHQRRLAEAIYLGIVDYLLGRRPGTAVSGRTEGDATDPEGETPAVRVALGPAPAPAPGPVPESGLVHVPEVAPGASPIPEGVTGGSTGTLGGGGRFWVYFADAQEDEGGLVAVPLTFPAELAAAGTAERARYALKALARGPEAESGLAPTLPPETKVLDVTFEMGRLHVDLSREVRTRFWGGGKSEERLVEAVVRTAGQFEEVREVALSVEGRSEESLAGHVEIEAPFPVRGATWFGR